MNELKLEFITKVSFINVYRYLLCGRHKLYKTSSKLIQYLERQVSQCRLKDIADLVPDLVDDFVATPEAPWPKLPYIDNKVLRDMKDHPDDQLKQEARTLWCTMYQER